MNITSDRSPTMNQDHDRHCSNTNNSNSSPDQPPPPYSPTSCTHDEGRVPSYNPACVSDADQPSAPSLYPEIPQQLPMDHQPHHQQYYQQQQQLNMPFPMPQPYIQEQAIYHPHSSTPFYHHHHQQGYPQYGTINPNHNTNPHFPAPSPPPAGFHTVHLAAQTQPGFFHQHHQHHHHPNEEDDRSGRCLPIGALVFIFGWIFPPLFVLGICCASSRHANERWWARLNLTMALLLLLSSILYSMFGPEDALLALFAFRQEK